MLTENLRGRGRGRRVSRAARVGPPATPVLRLTSAPPPPVGLQLPPPRTQPASRSTMPCGLPCAPSKGSPKGLACPRLPDPWRERSAGHLPGPLVSFASLARSSPPSPRPWRDEAPCSITVPTRGLRRQVRDGVWRPRGHRRGETGRAWVCIQTWVSSLSHWTQLRGPPMQTLVLWLPSELSGGNWEGPVCPERGAGCIPSLGPSPGGRSAQCGGSGGRPGGGGQDSRGRCGHSRPGPAGTGVPAVNSASCHLPKRSTCPGGR